ncbi:MAG TPA: hypothetical protein VNZ26_35120 [Vicinamibacterales bacterium]|jgi:DNA-directed RNA polymerase specialized sigma24 family protein|nr:hypothetical protein [Vicinamibacterales bacterium]
MRGVADPGAEDESSISAAGLERLLTRLDADAERAGAEYERLRRALIRFFDWRGASAPEECADETLDRLAKKLADTVVQNLNSYARGIARLVLLEHQRRPDVSASRVIDWAKLRARPPEDETSGLRECLDRCLTTLSGEGRTLLLRYYEGERSEKIANRQDLAESHGLSENALRCRVHRLRDRLEACLRSCISGGNRS